MKIGISLGIGAPPHTAALLAQAGFRIVVPNADAGAEAEFSVSFAPVPCGAGRRKQEVMVQCREGDGRPRGESIAVADPAAAASFVISRIGGAPAPMLTADRAAYDAIARAMQAARRRMSLLVEGETGTGKKMLVRLFHAIAGRGLLVLVNGSVANVSRAASGCAETRGIGTLFIDNVDELPAEEQAAILGVIRAAAERRSNPNPAMIRYAAATRRNLERIVRQGGFSRELYRELAGAAVYLPPLRERRGDIALLAAHFLARLSPEFSFSDDALAMLADYPFPGNVRELENLVRRLSIVPLNAGTTVIHCADVRNQIIVAARQRTQDPGAGWHACLREAQREIALRTIAACAGDYRAAAGRLGMTLAMLRECVAGSDPPPGGEPRS